MWVVYKYSLVLQFTCNLWKQLLQMIQHPFALQLSGPPPTLLIVSDCKDLGPGEGCYWQAQVTSCCIRLHIGIYAPMYFKKGTQGWKVTNIPVCEAWADADQCLQTLKHCRYNKSVHLNCNVYQKWLTKFSLEGSQILSICHAKTIKTSLCLSIL